MVERERTRMTKDEAGALVSIVLLALWTIGSIWYHLTHTAGAEQLEYVFLIVMAVMLLVAGALYAFRVRWSYPIGILVCLGFFVEIIKAIIDDTLFFSISAYNLLVLVVLLVALAAVVFSVRAMRATPPRRWWHTALGIVGAALLAAGVAWAVGANTSRISELNANLVLGRMRRDMADIAGMEEKIEYILEEGDLPSAIVGIVIDDELVWMGAFGEGVDLDTIYNVGSIAKPITATAGLQLVERGLLDLDADISEYLPFYVRHPEYPETPITTRMLLSHQSGIGHHTPIYAAYMGRDGYLHWDEAHRGRSLYGEVIHAEDDPDFGTFLEGYLTPGGAYYTPQAWTSNEPGSSYNYSSPGYDLLGFMVETISGQSYDDYLREKIFEPLGMHSTGRLSEDPPLAQATPVERVYGVMWKTNVEAPIFGSGRIGGGGLYSTVPDLAQFLIAHMNGGRVGGTRILTPESVALMHAPHVSTQADIGMQASGYGWALFREQSWQYWDTSFDFYGAQGHGGSDIGYRARMWYVEEEGGGYGMIILTNLANFFKPDTLWSFSTYLQFENLVMDEAKRLWVEKHGG